MGVGHSGDSPVQGDWYLHHEERRRDSTDVGRSHRDGSGNVLLTVQETI